MKTFLASRRLLVSRRRLMGDRDRGGRGMGNRIPISVDLCSNSGFYIALKAVLHPGMSLLLQILGACLINACMLKSLSSLTYDCPSFLVNTSVEGGLHATFRHAKEYILKYVIARPQSWITRILGALPNPRAIYEGKVLTEPKLINTKTIQRTPQWEPPHHAGSQANP